MKKLVISRVRYPTFLLILSASNIMASSRPGGVRRVLAKCKASIEAGNFYEAHQMYRTLYFRYVSTIVGLKEKGALFV